MSGRRIRTVLVENGVDVDHFATTQPEPAEYCAIAGPRAVYVGAIDKRFDLAAVVAAARALPRVQFLIIGPQASTPADVPANLHLLGSRPYAELPAYLQHADVGLLPFADSIANSGRSPMKYYEYLAAGLRVVASDTPELRRRNTPGVFFYSAGDPLAGAVAAALDAPRNAHAARRNAEPYSWQGRASLVIASIHEFTSDAPSYDSATQQESAATMSEAAMSR